ncbi:MAG: hypothetical protein MJ237_05630 [bacterium]|nr:hypothetical protein [bacterium]
MNKISQNINTYSITPLIQSESFNGKHCDYGYSRKQKVIVATTTALGVGISLAILAKRANYSLKPKDMFKDIKNSYLSKVAYQAPEIITIGAGTCIGGLVGGCIIDKNKNNRKSKAREALLQIGNISIPILTVDLFVDKIFANTSKWGKAIAGLGGVFAGVYLANFIMNKINNLIFNNKDGRKVKATDYSAHLDDVVVAANYISQSPIIHSIGRIIPIALMIAGNEVGLKQSQENRF